VVSGTQRHLMESRPKEEPKDTEGSSLSPGNIDVISEDENTEPYGIPSYSGVSTIHVGHLFTRISPIPPGWMGFLHAMPSPFTHRPTNASSSCLLGPLPAERLQTFRKQRS
jgi:hypothetical protein